MENILLPSKIEIKEGKDANSGIIEISPCYFGYGTTLGNALRRVLLSSLPGAAVFAVKIKGAQHEFGAIPGVLEDVLEILLNFKRLRLKSFSDVPVRLKIKSKGKGVVTANDIEANSDVEVVNKDLPLATLTTKDAEFEAELFVEKGRGYVPTEQRDKKSLELGMMAIDSIFSPVLSVGYKVENVRVGQITDYDKLILNIETDGTITPAQALSESAKMLINYFNLLVIPEEQLIPTEMPASIEEAAAAEEPQIQAVAEEEPVKKKRSKTKK